MCTLISARTFSNFVLSFNNRFSVASDLYSPTISLPVFLHCWMSSVEGMSSLRMTVFHGSFSRVIVWCHFSVVVIVAHGSLEMAASLHSSLARTVSRLSFLARTTYRGSLSVTDAEMMWDGRTVVSENET